MRYNIYKGTVNVDTLDKDIVEFYDFNEFLLSENNDRYHINEATDLGMSTVEYLVHLANQQGLSGLEEIGDVNVT